MSDGPFLENETYVKLFASILDSSIWLESSETKLVWITMLAMANATGYVGATIPNLAARAGVPVAETQAAVDKFLAPDPHSRSPEFEGRRIENAPRGWRILNYERFRAQRDPEKRRKQVREATKRWREKIAARDAEQPPDEAYECGETP